MIGLLVRMRIFVGKLQCPIRGVRVRVRVRIRVWG